MNQDDLQRHNRITRFTYVAGSPAATLATELVMLTSAVKFDSVHSAGWLGFTPSAYASPVRKKRKNNTLCFCMCLCWQECLARFMLKILTCFST